MFSAHRRTASHLLATIRHKLACYQAAVAFDVFGSAVNPDGTFYSHGFIREPIGTAETNLKRV